MKILIKALSKAKRYFYAVGLGKWFDLFYCRVREYSIKKEVLEFDKMMLRYADIQLLGLAPRMIDVWHMMRSDGMHNSWSESGIYFSQCGQDRFVDLLFTKPGYQGVFLDIGANHPITINNTYYFEKKGWTGLAFEPITDICMEWKEKRSTPCLNIALGSETRDIEFLLHDKDYLSHRSEMGERKAVDPVEPKNEEGQIITVKQRNINDVLNEYNIHNIDYCSLDVEGCELEILNSLDFNTNTIKVFSIENEDSPDSIYDTRKFLNDKGYWLIARLGQDDVFVNGNYFYLS